MNNMLGNSFEATTALAALFLWLMFNMFGGMLNCDLQRVIHTNPTVRNILAIVAFYFLFTVIDPNNNIHVGVVFAKTIVVYLLFVLLIKSRLVFAGTALSLLLVDQVLKNHVAYLEKKERDPAYVERFKRARAYIFWIFVAVAVVGTIDYFIKQKREHGERFSYKLFFMGTHMCRN